MSTYKNRISFQYSKLNVIIYSVLLYYPQLEISALHSEFVLKHCFIPYIILIRIHFVE